MPVSVCVRVYEVGGGEIITWQQPAVLIPLHLWLSYHLLLNWEQMRVAGDRRPGRERRFNYLYGDRQDRERRGRKWRRTTGDMGGKTDGPPSGQYCLFGRIYWTPI